MTRHHGLTIREVFSLLVITSIVIAVMLPVLADVRDGARTQRDAVQILDTHQALLQSAASDIRGRLIIPALECRPRDARGNALYTSPLNTTANLYSILIGSNRVDAEILVSPSEPNPNVVIKTDYRFDAYRHDAPSNIWWDSNFQSDLTSVSHASYAHLPIFGNRAAYRWNNSGGWGGSTHLGNRGVAWGDDADSLDYLDSCTLKIHGPNDIWHGHMCDADHSLRYLESSYTEDYYYRYRSSTCPDNIFQSDLPDESAIEEEALDRLLTFTRRIIHGDLVKDRFGESRIEKVIEYQHD